MTSSRPWQSQSPGSHQSSSTSGASSRSSDSKSPPRHASSPTRARSTSSCDIHQSPFRTPTQRSRILDPTARGDVLLILGKECVAESKELLDPLVRDRVVGNTTIPPRRHKAAPAQTGQMIRDVRLAQPRPLDQLANPKLPLLTQQLEETQATRVG